VNRLQSATKNILFPIMAFSVALLLLGCKSSSCDRERGTPGGQGVVGHQVETPAGKECPWTVAVPASERTDEDVSLFEGEDSPGLL
jgi:hypothetical protein